MWTTACRAAAVAQARLRSRQAEERNLAMRILLHSPKDLIAGAVAFAAVSAIIANAMFMQAGHHPSPMFGTPVSAPWRPPIHCRGRGRSRPR